MEKGLLGEPVVVGQGAMALDWTKVDLNWVSGWNFFHDGGETTELVPQGSCGCLNNGRTQSCVIQGFEHLHLMKDVLTQGRGGGLDCLIKFPSKPRRSPSHISFCSIAD